MTKAPAGTTPAPSLWRDRAFLTFWSGQTASRFGEQISDLAIPVLAVLLLHATAFQVGVLNAATTAAFLVIGLPAGAWIDRMRKRHVMIAADVVRALTLACIPVLWVAGVLQVWHLYLVALVIGVATVFFDVSYQSVVPALVRAEQIPEANGRLESTSQIAQLGGPAFAGWLVGVLSGPIAILVTACTYLGSCAALVLTRDSEQPRAAEDRAPLRREIGEGLRWVFGNPLLRRIVGTTAVSNLFSTATYTLLPIFLLRHLGFTPVGMGVVFSLGAVGGVLGAVAMPRVVRRVGEARTIPMSAIAFSTVSLLLPVAALVPAMAFPLLVVQGFVASFTVVLYNVTQVSFRQRITPGRLLGRMNASIRFIVWGVMPLGALAAGGLATALGIVPVLWIAAGGELLSALFVVTGPLWSLRDLPDAA